MTNLSPAGAPMLIAIHTSSVFSDEISNNHMKFINKKSHAGEALRTTKGVGAVA